MAEKGRKRTEETEVQAAVERTAQPLWKGKQVFFGDATAEVTNRNMALYEALLRSPAQFDLLTLAARLLAEVEEQRGGMNTRPLKAYAALVMPDRHLYIVGAPESDRKAFRVRRRAGGLRVNLRRLLQKHNLLVEPGWRHRYEVRIVPDSPFGGPALFCDLTQILRKEEDPETADTKGQKSAEKEKEQPAPQAAQAPQAPEREVAIAGGQEAPEVEAGRPDGGEQAEA